MWNAEKAQHAMTYNNHFIQYPYKILDGNNPFIIPAVINGIHSKDWFHSLYSV